MSKAKKSYRELLKDELLEVARKLGLTNISKLRKEEILDLVEKAEAKREKLAKPAAKSASPAKSPTTPATSKSASPAKSESPAAPPSRKAPAKKTPSNSDKAAAQSGSETSAPTGKISRKQEPAAESVSAPRPGPLGPVSAQAGAVASKYSVAPGYRPEELQGVDERLPELPESYGDNRIVLLPRDLSWLFAYWDLTSEYKEAARAAGGSVLALRLYDVTGLDFDGTNAHGMQEHECAEWARSWYLPTPAPDRDYIVEIGYRGADQWFPLARSNRVSVPSEQPSTWIKDDFISIRFDEDLREIRDRLGASEAPQGPTTASSQQPHTLFEDGELRIMVGGAFLPPSGAPTWPPFSGAQEVIAGSLQSSQAFAPGSAAFLPGSAAYLPGSAAFVAGSAAFIPGSAAFIPGSLGQLPSSQSFMVPGLLPSSPGFMRHPLAGESLRGGPGATGPGAPASEGSAGSPEGAGADGKPPEPEPPVITASVEMVIIGRSVPGAELRIAGRAIPMGPDGAFSLRVTVPEGLRELPIEARWVNANDTRRITLKLGRESE